MDFEAAMEFGVPIPTIDSAVSMRQISALKHERVGRSKIARHRTKRSARRNARARNDTFCRTGIASGLYHGLRKGSRCYALPRSKRATKLDLVEIVKIWRGGCIIRSALFEQFRQAISADPSYPNSCRREPTGDNQKRTQHPKGDLKFAIAADIPCMAFASALNY